ncbi:MAG: hypothetical protein M3P91_03280, partial [Actinomycetota bacterium]|nr:hypothetical protein [Actinomycetota bacterium]
MNDDLSATVANVRALHSLVVDAVLEQEPDNYAAIVRLMGGLTSQAFVRAVYKTGFARVCSSIENGRLVYRVQLKGDDGWVGLCGATAEALGIPDTPEVREQEIRFHTERML